MAKTTPPQPDWKARAADGVVAVITKLIEQGLDWKLAGVLSAAALGYVYALPQADRKDLDVLGFLERLVAPASLFWPGMACILATLLTLSGVVGWVAIRLGKRRIAEIGQQLVALRAKDDGGRLTSQDIGVLKRYHSDRRALAEVASKRDNDDADSG